jgi:Lrp/AsnC family leucine-responsive transcriptional regulator
MSLRIDEVDAQIIELLRLNGRMLYKDIAKSVGVSIPTAKSRVKRLVELGVIKRFTIALDHERIWGRVRLLLLASIQSLNIEELKKKLENIKEIRAFYTTAGEKQILIDAEVGGLERVDSFVSEMVRELGLTNISSFVVTSVLKEEFGSSVEPNTALRFRCDFCGAVIYGKPLIEYIDGGRYYFSAKSCAEAYKQRYFRKSNSFRNKTQLG